MGDSTRVDVERVVGASLWPVVRNQLKASTFDSYQAYTCVPFSISMRAPQRRAAFASSGRSHGQWTSRIRWYESNVLAFSWLRTDWPPEKLQRLAQRRRACCHPCSEPPARFWLGPGCRAPPGHRLFTCQSELRVDRLGYPTVRSTHVAQFDVRRGVPALSCPIAPASKGDGIRPPRDAVKSGAGMRSSAGWGRPTGHRLTRPLACTRVPFTPSQCFFGQNRLSQRTSR